MPDLSAPTEPESLDWLLTSFAKRVPDVTYALAVSVDGLALAATAGLPQDQSDHLSAITSGLASLTVGAARCLTTGRVRQTIIDMDGGVLLVMAVGDRAQLAVLASPGCDLGQTGYETALLAQRVAVALDPDARVPGQL
ncbi:putative regulator of Ras-like GTPase activity (Roadblock/LC7/MglB family) [Allocatelliglobosispora scoriae]|uniref:Putative regulator of Ras-like GTPase activity (Roadblock/LC7/MglB family) n=1 Tax=Allocatelliglobosispora scoriae TaxID=643052 RepID=A0A841BXK9_9ACTN|nr:roadblock/LC7 domain-containing protein [Allocatelliglobosispora scoriae]MBB5872894.1 putative regulator of Ras-like GTPase activity (Roadblock/LC7/MglB family) [Allocatelliglobosispora scoriae]